MADYYENQKKQKKQMKQRTSSSICFHPLILLSPLKPLISYFRNLTTSSTCR